MDGFVIAIGLGLIVLSLLLVARSIDRLAANVRQVSEQLFYSRVKNSRDLQSQGNGSAPAGVAGRDY